MLLGLAALLALATAWAVSVAQAQSDDEQTGRIVAQRLDDGRTEFGWQPAGGERVLPRARYFPAAAPVDRWLRSSPVEVDGAEIGRINARLRDDGRIEFAFTLTNGEQILPPSRYFPANARVGRWLRSTEIAISAAPATGFVAVSAGFKHTCAIRETGEVKCWGYDSNYQVSDALPGRFIAVSAGWWHTCGLRENGAIECWGGAGVRGEINQDVPPGRFSAVSVGARYTCGLRESGAIECWGRDRSGVQQVDREGNVVKELYVYGLTDPPPGRFIAISTGDHNACGLRDTGAIECWGSNWYGEADAPAGRFSAVGVSGSLTCGLRDTGAIECWGAGPSNPLTDRFTALSARDGFICGLRDTGAIECDRAAPAGRFSAVSAGVFHACGLRENGAIECWGYNDEGQTDAPAP